VNKRYRQDLERNLRQARRALKHARIAARDDGMWPHRESTQRMLEAIVRQKEAKVARLEARLRGESTP
jgi:hypothetical protein